MTAREFQCRQQQLLRRLQTTIQTHETLAQCDDIRFEFVGDGITVDGSVPTENHRGEVIPMVRQAGVLCRVENRVRIAG